MIASASSPNWRSASRTQSQTSLSECDFTLSDRRDSTDYLCEIIPNIFEVVKSVVRCGRHMILLGNIEREKKMSLPAHITPYGPRVSVNRKQSNVTCWQILPGGW